MEEQYKILVEFIKYEGQRLWQVFHLYLLVHILLLGLIISLRNEQNQTFLISLGIFGTFLCVPWAGAYFHHSQLYMKRIQQAKVIENKMKWNILNDEPHYEIFETIFRPKYTTPFIVIGFSVIYILLTISYYRGIVILMIVPTIIFYAHIIYYK